MGTQACQIDRRGSGGARRDRTADLLHAMQALSQLSYGPTCIKLQRFATQALEDKALTSKSSQRAVSRSEARCYAVLGPPWNHHGTTKHRRRPEHVAWLHFSLETKRSAYLKRRHDSKPEGSRLPTNAITGLKPRRTRYDVTDQGCARVQRRVMPSGVNRRCRTRLYPSRRCYRMS